MPSLGAEDCRAEEPMRAKLPYKDTGQLAVRYRAIYEKDKQGRSKVASRMSHVSHLITPTRGLKHKKEDSNSELIAVPIRLALG